MRLMYRKKKRRGRE